MTNETKHTPGPWRMRDTIKNYKVIELGARGIAQVACNDPQGHANARLISAGPELLQALEALRDRALKDAYDKGLDDSAPIYAFIQDATDAIIKARGGYEVR